VGSLPDSACTREADAGDSNCYLLAVEKSNQTRRGVLIVLHDRIGLGVTLLIIYLRHT
jgi:hypothetical protein